MTAQEFDNISRKVRWKLLAVAKRFINASRIPDKEDDIVQEALIELWELIQKGYPVKDPEAMAVIITKRICIDKTRKKKPIAQPLETIDSSSFTAAETISEEEIERTKRKLFDKLSDTQKMLLQMRYDFEMSLDEISEESGKPKSSIKVTISNARKQMLEEIKKGL